jgi:hypothetical protein
MAWRLIKVIDERTTIPTERSGATFFNSDAMVDSRLPAAAETRRACLRTWPYALGSRFVYRH